jgi:abortive infection bacteriophage resistance protein
VEARPVKYPKPPLSFPDQADLLIGRGLLADRAELIDRLAAVNYYRLSAYWYTFRVPGDPDEKLRPDTTLEKIWHRYAFDRHLRLHVMDAIERIEIAIRTQVVNRFTLKYGPFGYLDRANLPGLDVNNHRKMLDKIRGEAQSSREDFVRHYFTKYSSETDLPLWMACELMTFGTLYTLYRGLKTRMKKDIAQDYGIQAPVLSSWLSALNQVRNICAHHSRLWNREFGVRPQIPNATHSPDWHNPLRIDNTKAFGILTLLHYLLKQVAPQSQWKSRMKVLFGNYPDVPLRFLGFPEEWEDSPLWHEPDSPPEKT